MTTENTKTGKGQIISFLYVIDMSLSNSSSYPLLNLNTLHIVLLNGETRHEVKIRAKTINF